MDGQFPIVGRRHEVRRRVGIPLMKVKAADHDHQIISESCSEWPIEILGASTATYARESHRKREIAIVAFLPAPPASPTWSPKPEI